jgi:hypothetical protein
VRKPAHAFDPSRKQGQWGTLSGKSTPPYRALTIYVPIAAIVLTVDGA